MTADAHSQKVAVVIGATSKWQPDGRNTRMRHGGALEAADFPVGIRWGVGGAVAQRFAAEGFHTVLTTRAAANAAGLKQAIEAAGGRATIVELDLRDKDSISAAFTRIRAEAGEPEIVVYNAGYLEGRDMPAGQELLEYVTDATFDMAIDLACRAPFWVAREVLPAMRRAGAGSLFFTSNQYALRGRKRLTGESLYYPRALVRTLAQVLTEEYSEHGVHVADVIVDGYIDSPGTRMIPEMQANPARLIDPARIAEVYFQLHRQDRSCWTHEIQVTSHAQRVSW